MTTPQAPIACTLDAASYAGRIAEIRTLFARSLKGSRREGSRLHLTFDPAARADVQELVRKENTCCAFLDFQLAEHDGAVELTIAVPERAIDSADEIFAPFTVEAVANS